MIVTEDVENWMTRNHFLLRRLHSLLGIVPVGFFLIEHLLTNSLAFWPEKFNEQVYWLHNLHYLFALEIVFIFLPLAFHAIYGVAIAWSAKQNATQYPYLDNWRFLLQRYTGYITLIFVLVHLGHFRFAYLFGGEHYVGAADPFGLTQRGFYEIAPGVIWFPIYLVGFTAAVYHFCNGLVTFCITWGIAISVASRKRLSIAAGGVFAVLMIWGIMALYALRTIEYTPTAAPGEAARVVQQQAVLPESGS